MHYFIKVSKQAKLRKNFRTSDQRNEIYVFIWDDGGRQEF
jgi:hypothetical protein